MVTRSWSRYSWQCGQSARWRFEPPGVACRQAADPGSRTSGRLRLCTRERDGATTASSPHLLAEGAAHPGPPSMEQDALIGIADPEHRTDLGRVQALHVPQEHDLALCSAGDSSRQACARAANFRATRRSSASSAQASGAGAQAPPASKCSGPSKLRVEICGCPVTALTLARALGSVDQDGVEPGGNTQRPSKRSIASASLRPASTLWRKERGG